MAALIPRGEVDIRRGARYDHGMNIFRARERPVHFLLKFQIFFLSGVIACLPLERNAYPLQPLGIPKSRGQAGEAGRGPSTHWESTQPTIPPLPDLLDTSATEPSSTTRYGNLRNNRIASEEFVLALEEEERLMMGVVQLLDRQSAQQWLASFLSEKPLSCPQNRQQEWIEAIIFAVERNGLPLCKEILGLTATIISIESSFRRDPLAVDPSRHENMAKLLERAEQDIQNKLGPLWNVFPVPQLYATYRDRYYPRLMECRTEGDIEVLAKAVAEELRQDAKSLPEFLQKLIFRELDKVSHVVRTKGSMQLNFLRASQVMRDRGEQFTDSELCDYMYTLNGGIDVGVAALKPMFVQYAARYAVPGDLSWLFFVGMDYHYGPFSSRNMMEQIRIRDLSRQNIPIDGDLLRYDENGQVKGTESFTLSAVLSIFPKVVPSKIFEDFVLEKDPHYIYTETHRAITEVHRRQFGETPFAVIGELWMGHNAQIKHGSAWKTSHYLRKLDVRLNALPWDR